MDTREPRRVLLIDNHPDNRALLARTLMRKFPKVILTECQDLQTSVNAAGMSDLDVIILHRTDDAAAVDLVREIRAVNAHTPIVVVSGVDRSGVVMAAGATGFLNFDEWLRIGSIVEKLLASPESLLRADLKEQDGPQF